MMRAMSPDSIPSALAVIAGRGVYPRLLAESARTQGVDHLVAIAFKGETGRVIDTLADKVHWIHLGQFGHMLDALRASGVTQAVMAGQIKPTHLFRVRMDAKMLDLLRKLRVRNAETIFGAVADELKALDIDLLPASAFMEQHMPPAGVLTARLPSQEEWSDVELGMRVARTTSALDVGQTVVVKEGTILAVEAFEGTDKAIRRAARLGGPGTVIAKTAKAGHDMRFDIPVIGLHTLKVLKRSKAAVLAVEAKRAILLERNKIIEEANRIGLSIVSVEASP